MQTQLAATIRDTPTGQEAEEILRKCVHCGFCTATCPTYLLLGNELDGPRGRIYLIKQLLEGAPITEKTQQHLDRCLVCRSCETTCPSGVKYTRLLDFGRQLITQQLSRTQPEKTIRWVLREVLPRPKLFGAAFKVGVHLRPMLPARLKTNLPDKKYAAGPWPQTRHTRRMLTLAGCVQPALSPAINHAAARVLDTLGISLIESPQAGCCGAVRFHLDDLQGAQKDARRNIDAWWPLITKGNIEHIVITSSGCGVQVKDYAYLLKEDPAYAEKATLISQRTVDISEVVTAEAAQLKIILRAQNHPKTNIAWHAPCSLQHGLKIQGSVEKILQTAGFILASVDNAHLCCGAAGTYSLLQPALSKKLLKNKITALTHTEVALIASANIGCIQHLKTNTNTSIYHWIELIDARLNGFPLIRKNE